MTTARIIAAAVVSLVGAFITVTVLGPLVEALAVEVNADRVAGVE